MQKISPFIWFDYNAEEAMNFYLLIFKDSKIIRVARNSPGAPGPEGAFLVATKLQQELEPLFNSQNKSSGKNTTSIPATFLKVEVTV